MAVMRVNPNRMELLRLRQQLNVARRGHKLLKDKRDELMRQFLAIVKKNKALRDEVEELLTVYNQAMILARAVMPEQVIESALYAGHDNFYVQMKTKNVMSVTVPEFSLPATGDLKKAAKNTNTEQQSNGVDQDKSQQKTLLPYGLSGVSGELDQAILALQQALPAMIELANIEKTTQLLANEISKTRRRVNSLEHRMIPDLEDTIRSITMKMEENERANTTRLMKVKDMILEKEILERRQRNEKLEYQTNNQ
ncbi:MAG: V-type ATP synthase subunit D [Clostridiaceae bacterium]|nr:V-type ATP synthase subunit D [Clostridiaceae bacterium]